MLARALAFLSNLVRRQSELRRILLSLAAAFVVILIGCGVVVTSLIGDMNRTAREAQRQTVAHVVESNVEDMRRATYMTAHWNEGAARLYGRLDRDWALTNIVSDASIPRHVFVLDSRGETLFARQWNKKDAPALRSSAPAALDRMLKYLPRSQADERNFRQGVAFVGKYRGRPALIAASVIVPEDVSARTAIRDYRHIVYVQEFGPETIGPWAKQFFVDRLTWSPTPSADRRIDSLALDSIDARG